MYCVLRVSSKLGPHQKGPPMKPRPKHLPGVFVVGLVLTLLAACGSGDNGAKDSSDGAGKEGEKVALRFAGFDTSQTPAMEAFIAAFHEKQKDITVKYETVPFNQYATKLQVEASSKNLPDVFWMHANDRDLYASEGMTQQLDELIEKSKFDLSVFPEAAMAQQKYNGGIYGLPRGAATIELWYNKEIFDAAGVDHPTDEWTWDDLKAAAEKLSDPKKGVYGVVAPYDGTQSFYNTIYQAGGRVLAEDKKSALFDDPKTIEGIRFWTDLIEAGHAPTYKTTLDTAADSLFTSGKAAMIYAGAWFPGIFDANADIKDKIDVVEMPAGPAGDATLMGANAYAMSAHSKNPDAAWEFLSFISGPEGAKVAAQSKVITQPAEKTAVELWAAQFPQWNMSAIVGSAQNGIPSPTSKLTTEWTGKMIDALAPAFDLKVSPEEATANADKAIEAVLAKENS